MKQIKLVGTALIIAASLTACKSNTAKGSATSSSNTENTTTAPSSQEGGTFSCIINGKEVSGKDPLKNNGYLSDGDSGKVLSLQLQDDVASEHWPFTHSLIFGLPAQEGNETDESDLCSGKLSTFGPDGFVYPSNGIVINITKLSNTEVAGTFSGKFMPENISRSDTMYVTDGKFDIPLRTQ